MGANKIDDDFDLDKKFNNFNTLAVFFNYRRQHFDRLLSDK